MQTNQKCRIINRDLIKFIAIIPMAGGHFIDFYFGASASLHNSLFMFLLAHASLIASPIFLFHSGRIPIYSFHKEICSQITYIYNNNADPILPDDKRNNNDNEYIHIPERFFHLVSWIDRADNFRKQNEVVAENCTHCSFR